MSALVFRVRPASRTRLRNEATDFRHLLGLDDAVFFPIVEVVEYALPSLVPGFVLDVRPSVEMGRREGFTPLHENTIELREDVYCNACNRDGRARFTVAHEVAHLILHANVGGLAREEGNVPAYMDPEWQANTFAGNLLVHWNCVDPSWDVEVLMRECGVSYAAAKLQMKLLREDELI